MRQLERPISGAAAAQASVFERLGVTASYSRPRVSDDNPFSEALFRTCKDRPDWPKSGFASKEDAQRWVAHFVAWYNTEHRHSAIRFVTPSTRHTGEDRAILARSLPALYRSSRRQPRAVVMPDPKLDAGR